MSLSAWQEHLQPRLRRWCDLIHSHGKKVLFHTDGAARDFVPHLIESGVDILNPIQHICPGMDRAELNRDFGDRVIFHGGVENQHVLPYGSVADVRAETVKCLETLGQGGGYIPSSCHNIQAGTPVENILAMIETVWGWKC
jgi:uroporphyrinogen decarboxylase